MPSASGDPETPSTRGTEGPEPTTTSDEKDGTTDRPLKVLYIAGAMRSGSTILTRTLGEVDGFLGAGEVFHFFGRAMARNELCSCGVPAHECPLWGEVIGRVGPPAGFEDAEAAEEMRRAVSYGRHLATGLLSRMGLPLPDSVGRYRELLGRVYTALGRVSGARVLVDASKVPGYGWLLEGLPGVELSVLHLVRDSRGVVHSWSRRKRRPGAGRGVYMNRFGPIGGSLLWAVSQIGAEALRTTSGRGLRVRYSDFTEDPAGVVRRVGRLLEEPVGTLDHIRDGTLFLSAQHTLAGNPVRMRDGGIALREDTAWREGLEPAHRRVVTALTWPLLRRYAIRA